MIKLCVDSVIRAIEDNKLPLEDATRLWDALSPRLPGLDASTQTPPRARAPERSHDAQEPLT